MKGIIKHIIKRAAEDLTAQIVKAIDEVSVVTDTVKAEIAVIILESLTTLALANRVVIIAELAVSLLQRSWRPIVMLMFATIVVYTKFLAPVFRLPVAELDSDFWILLEFGIGGFVIGRSLEKITKNVNQRFNKTKQSHEELFKERN